MCDGWGHTERQIQGRRYDSVLVYQTKAVNRYKSITLVKHRGGWSTMEDQYMGIKHLCLSLKGPIHYDDAPHS